MDELGCTPAWCSACVPQTLVGNAESNFPCCSRACDCLSCRSSYASDLYDQFNSHFKSRKRAGKRGENKFFGISSGVVTACIPVDFALTDSFLEVRRLAAPTPKPMKRVKTKGKELKKLLRRAEKKNGSAKDVETQNHNRVKEDYTVFKPTCAREFNYEAQKQMKYSVSFGSPQSTELPRNLREGHQRLITETDADDKTSQSRDARVKQRRIVKGVADFSGLGLDMLASRESQLSFGRSKIHGWGVFADSDIATGDMIVEYRGEIIGNAQAEKREQEYERTKLGLDYMFRIDKDTVCDATKLGNVARFINASCEPNCYARIITVGGDKRIAIYAKHLIRAGEEVCYDYKFPIECKFFFCTFIFVSEHPN
jgi:hypothetical protein